MFNVNAELFRAAALFQSTEETRFYLNGVHIEAHPDGGAILVATDGHRMFVAHDAEGECDVAEGYIVNLDKSALATKQARGQTAADRIIGGVPTDPVQIVGGHGVAALCPNWNVGGTFPDWRRITPSAPPKLAPAWYDPALLAAFVRAAKLISGGSPGTVISGDGSGPAIVRFSGIKHAFGVLMPMRGDGVTGLPSFMLKAVKAPAPKRRVAKQAEAA